MLQHRTTAVRWNGGGGVGSIVWHSVGARAIFHTPNRLFIMPAQRTLCGINSYTHSGWVMLSHLERSDGGHDGYKNIQYSHPATYKHRNTHTRHNGLFFLFILERDTFVVWHMLLRCLGCCISFTSTQFRFNANAGCARRWQRVCQKAI